MKQVNGYFKNFMKKRAKTSQNNEIK